MTSFAQLAPSLTPWLLATVQHTLGLTHATPVQAATVPLFMQNKDVVVEAVTGSGKTLAYAIPVLERLIRRSHPLARHDIAAIVVSPTRELAAQIHAVFSTLINDQPTSEGTALLAPLLLTGGSEPLSESINYFRQHGANILIGTPGRLEEFLLGQRTQPSKKPQRTSSGRQHGNVKELEVLVMDEADRLLDLGFIPVLTALLSHLPKQRRTGLFSATMTDALSGLVRVGLRNPVKIVVKVQAKGKNKSIEEQEDNVRAPIGLDNRFVIVKSEWKFCQLLRRLKFEDDQVKHRQGVGARKIIVYFSTCACVDHFYKVMKQMSSLEASIYSLHGQQSSLRRTQTFKSFTTCTNGILLCTDVAARGLDVEDVDLVIQIDAALDPKVMTHRIGRTARAGKLGRALLFLNCGREEEYVEFMRIRKVPMKRESYISEDLTPLVSSPVEDPEAQTFVSQTQTIILTDRSLHDSAVKAFVSFVKAYSKHEASFIFKVNDLNLVSVAKSFGIVRLPKMPELKQITNQGWLDITPTNWEKFGYKNSIQERQRLEKLARSKKSVKEMDGEDDKSKRKRISNSKVAWSNQVDRKVAKESRRDQKRQRIVTTETSQEVADGSEGEEQQRDWKEMESEKRRERKVRKLKSGSTISSEPLIHSFKDM